MARSSRALLLTIALAAAAAAGVPATASAATGPSAPFGSSAVVLVSGFNTASPFSTPSCPASGRGTTWGLTNGPALAIAAAGRAVFTAPVANDGGVAPASCLGGEYPDVPAHGDTIDSNGAMESNGRALVAFLAFLNSAYGITDVQLVGHSDGGLWSREAIDQLRDSGSSPVTVTTLTTMGTPHTGSFGADLAEAVNADGGSCSDLPPGVERDICDAFFASVSALIDDLGPTVIEELSSSWMAQWNPTTSIGCPVTVVGGDHVGFSVPGLSYYSPNDGIVGEASSMARGTIIPWVDAPPFTAVRPTPALFDVVHSPSLEVIWPATLLNTAAVTSAVLAAVQAPLAAPCVQAGAAAARTAGAAASSRAITVALNDREAARGGSVRRPRAGDAILLRTGSSARCGGRALPSSPLLGSRTVRVVIPRCSTRVTIRGRAMRVGPSAGGERLRVTRSGHTFRWTVTGGKLHRMRVELRRGVRWIPVHGTSVTPRAGGGAALRVRGVTRSGTVVRAQTRLELP